MLGFISLLPSTIRLAYYVIRMIQLPMIVNFKSKKTERLATTGESKLFKSIERVALRKWENGNAASKETPDFKTIQKCIYP